MSVNKQTLQDNNTNKGTPISKRLVIGKPGPFQIIESEVQGSIDNPINAPRRRYDCSNYETCLIIAAGLNWDSFTCRGCSGEFEESLHWRARQEINKDKTVKKICELPKAATTSSTPNTTTIIEGSTAVNAINSKTPSLKLVSKE